MAVMTLSRQLGSHDAEIASAVAKALRLRLVDASTIDQAALKAGVPDVALQELEHEGERGLVRHVLRALGTMPALPSTTAPAAPLVEESIRADRARLPSPFTGLVSAVMPPISASLDASIRLLGKVVRGLAHQGDVLIVGRGGQVLLRNHPHALHVQLVAPEAHRVATLMASLRLSKAEAQKRVRASDRSRSDYLLRYHNVDWLDPTLYHLVINTGRVPVQQAVDLIIAASRAIVEATGVPDLAGG